MPNELSKTKRSTSHDVTISRNVLSIHINLSIRRQSKASPLSKVVKVVIVVKVVESVKVVEVVVEVVVVNPVAVIGRSKKS